MTHESDNESGLTDEVRLEDGAMLDDLTRMDAVCARLRELDEDARFAIYDASRSWCERSGWSGHFEIDPDHIGWWISPPSWRNIEKNAHAMSLELGYFAAGDYPIDALFITPLFGSSLADLEVGLWMDPALSCFDRSRWASAVERNRYRLAAVGFRTRGDEVIKDICLPLAVAADAARRGSFAAVIGRWWTDTLESLPPAVRVIDDICREARI